VRHPWPASALLAIPFLADHLDVIIPSAAASAASDAHVCIRAGAWKLAGFAFSAPQDFQTPNQRAYDYSEPHPDPLQQVTQVCLLLVSEHTVCVAAGTTSVCNGRRVTWRHVSKDQL